jgi:hypothetical protein
MKIHLLVLALFSAIPLVSFMSSSGEPIAHRAMLDPVIYEGKIANWSVLADGTVAVRLVGTRENKAFSLWFVTPASQTATTRFEHLVLDAVLAFVGPLKDVSVTVVSDSSNEDSGKSIKDALVLSSIGHR